MNARLKYSVTSHGFDGQQKTPGAVDSLFDLEGALAHACTLIGRNEPNVAIQDGEGNSVSGDALVACCNGMSKLTANLRTEPK